MVAVRDGAQVLSGEYQTVLFQEDVKFQVLYGVGRITKEQESISGDNYSVLCENGQFVLCLSDGMGSGSRQTGRARRWWSCLNSSCAPDSRGSWRHG